MHDARGHAMDLHVSIENQWTTIIECKRLVPPVAVGDQKVQTQTEIPQ